ncbi:MAG: hypothetical protein AAFO69_03525 [Bacteroidota bacterium]
MSGRIAGAVGASIPPIGNALDMAHLIAHLDLPKIMRLNGIRPVTKGLALSAPTGFDISNFMGRTLEGINLHAWPLHLKYLERYAETRILENVWKGFDGVLIRSPNGDVLRPDDVFKYLVRIEDDVRKGTGPNLSPSNRQEVVMQNVSLNLILNDLLTSVKMNKGDFWTRSEVYGNEYFMGATGYTIINGKRERLPRVPRRFHDNVLSVIISDAAELAKFEAAAAGQFNFTRFREFNGTIELVAFFECKASTNIDYIGSMNQISKDMVQSDFANIFGRLMEARQKGEIIDRRWIDRVVDNSQICFNGITQPLMQLNQRGAIVSKVTEVMTNNRRIDFDTFTGLSPGDISQRQRLVQNIMDQLDSPEEIIPLPNGGTGTWLDLQKEQLKNLLRHRMTDKRLRNILAEEMVTFRMAKLEQQVLVEGLYTLFSKGIM